jgi:lipoprotein-releasing system permease protein
MTLVAVLSVMNGFQLGTIEDILEIDSYHIRVASSGDEGGAAVAPTGDTAPLEERLHKIRSLPEVGAAVPFIDLEVLAAGFFEDLQAIRMRGLAPDVGRRDRGFREAFDMAGGVFDIEAQGTVVLGVELARSLGVVPGDTLEVISLEGDGLARGTTVDLRVTGLFRSGYLDYDSGWAFVGLRTARESLGATRVPQVGVKLSDRYEDAGISRVLEERLPGSRVTSWRSYNRSIFGALRLEKNLMTILIGLIFLVVAGNMFQSLRRSVVERAEEIAILKALGAPPRSIQLIFIGEGGIIGLLGGGIGIGLGLLIAGNVNAIFRGAELVINGIGSGLRFLLGSMGGENFSLFSPRYFYITEVPAEILPGEVVGIFLFAFLCAAGAALLASTRVSKIRPSEVLRNE